MGDAQLTDDQAADLSRVREVHSVVDNLRRLLAAAVQAEEAGALAGARTGLIDPLLQSPPGR